MDYTPLGVFSEELQSARAFGLANVDVVWSSSPDGFRFVHKLNLNGPWPMRGPFDVIFCRNVAIYFDRDTRLRLLERMADLLDTEGWLVLGTSESLVDLRDRFRWQSGSIYRKIA